MRTYVLTLLFGRFQRLEDLLEIDGVGPATVEKIRPYVVLE